MKLRTKTIIFFISFLLVSTYFAMVMSHSVIDRYKEIDLENFENILQHTVVAYDDLVNQHTALLKDWSKWDDAYDFILDPNENFVIQNFVDTFFIDLQINYALLYDVNGELISGKGFDLNKAVEKAVPKDLVTFFDSQQDKVKDAGQVLINNQVILYTQSKVSNSTGQAPPRGTFVFCYEVKTDDVEAISRRVDNPVTLIIDQDGKMDVSDLSGYLAYKMANNNGVLFLKQDMPRDQLVLGRKTLIGYLALFALAMLIIGLTIYLGVRHTVTRIIKLNDDVSKIQASNNIKLRLNIKGRDELGVLRDNINDMLYQIESMHFQLTNYATYDNLTGVMNRRAGFERLEVLMKKSKLDNCDLTIAFVDVNNLKHVNDSFGHSAGDQYLQKVCRIIESNIRTTDVFCRAGGDEFLIIFSGCSLADAHLRMAAVDKDLKKINKTSDYKYPLSIAKGLVAYDGVMDIIHYVEQADEAMYENKSAMKVAKD